MLKRKQLLSRLKSETPRQFCDNHLFADEAFLFVDERTGVTGSYDDFRAYIAKQFDVNAKAIAIVGSAKLGFSLRPSTNEPLKPFRKVTTVNGPQSDVDLIIVGTELFEDCWERMLSAHYAGLFKSDNNNTSYNVFRKFVSLRSDAEYRAKSLHSFVDKMGTLQRDLQTRFRITYPINYRIYRSLSDAKNYHEYGIAKLKKGLGYA